jgi:hypothetical protein
MWLRPESATEITFVANGPHPSASYLSDMRKANKTLAALAPFSNPHVDTVAKSRHTYCRVTFSRDVSHVRFEYLPEFGLWDIKFLASVDCDLSETGQLVRVPSLVHPPMLMEVWKCCHIRDNILSRLPSPKESIIFDLDKHTISQALPPALGVNHAFRKLILALRPPHRSWCFTELSCFQNVECKVHMQSQSSRTSLWEFKALKH